MSVTSDQSGDGHEAKIQALIDTGDRGDLVDAIKLALLWIDEIVERVDALEVAR